MQVDLFGGLSVTEVAGKQKTDAYTSEIGANWPEKTEKKGCWIAFAQEVQLLECTMRHRTNKSSCLLSTKCQLVCFDAGNNMAAGW